jgi:hypothetical protein
MDDYRGMMDKMRREGQMERERVVRPSPTTGPKSFAMVNEAGSYGFGPGLYKGSGGYEYEVKSDGAVRIAKSPRSAGGQEVLPGAKFHDLIMGDIQRVMDTEKMLAELDKPAPVMDMGEEPIMGTPPMAKR